MIAKTPLVLCVDVGSFKNVGWADSEGQSGDGATLAGALERLASHLSSGGTGALGFEAPIWTPRRADATQITRSRGGIEITHNRAWSAGAGAGVLATALALMPWCLTHIANAPGGPFATTVDIRRFQEVGGLFLWEAFVSGTMKVAGTSHHDDARLACQAFVARWPLLVSDTPPEPAVNHAVSSALAVGLSIDPAELTLPGLVVGVAPSSA